MTGNYTKENYALFEYDLPFIDRKNCLKMLEPGYYGYITVDKFCTHSKSGINYKLYLISSLNYVIRRINLKLLFDIIIFIFNTIFSLFSF